MPVLILWKLVLCFTAIKIAIHRVKICNETSPKNKVDTNIVAADNVEDKETYLDILRLNKNVRKPIEKTIGDMAMNTPAEVATDFPPLNFAKIG